MSLDGDSFEQSLDAGYEWQLSDGLDGDASEFVEATADASAADDGEFTQHLTLSQGGGGTRAFTPHSQLEREFEALSLGAQSQEGPSSGSD